MIGYPLDHSFSKKYFTAKFEKEKLNDCNYELFPIQSIDNLTEILTEQPELIGLNVTIPYKQLVLPHLDSITNIPEGIMSSNCIRIVGGKLFGYNTDVMGFEKSLVPLLKSYHKRALVLGNGGATEAIIYVLKKLGIGYDIVSRQIHDGSTLTYENLNEKVIKENHLIINTTPVGMFPNIKDMLPIPYEYIGTQHLCYDLIYNPEKTIFLQKVETQGAVIKNGLEMLEIQAEESWKIWNDKPTVKTEKQKD